MKRENSDLIDILPDDFVEKYYKENYIDIMDIRDLVYYINIWDHIDDEKFVSAWIEGESDYHYDDFVHIFDKDNIISHIVKNVDTKDTESIMNEYNESEVYDELEELLDSLSFDEIKDIMENHLDIFDFITDHLDERYRNCNAYDILREFHNEDELMWLFIHEGDILNKYNLMMYFDEDKAREGIWDNEDSYYINERLSDSLENCVELHEKIFEIDKSTVKELVEFTGCDFVYTYEFQKEFMKRRKKKAIKKLYKTGILRDDIYEEYIKYLGPKVEAIKMGLL